MGTYVTRRNGRIGRVGAIEDCAGGVQFEIQELCEDLEEYDVTADQIDTAEACGGDQVLN